MLLESRKTISEDFFTGFDEKEAFSRLTIYMQFYSVYFIRELNCLEGTIRRGNMQAMKRFIASLLIVPFLAAMVPH